MEAKRRNNFGKRRSTPVKVGEAAKTTTSSYLNIVTCFLAVFCAGLIYRLNTQCASTRDLERLKLHPAYNATYPLTPPQTGNGETIYRIGAISDLDTDSKHPNLSLTWMSYYKTGYLRISDDRKRADVTWDATDTVLTSRLAEKGRGMELSDLAVFNGKLYSCDDRTGIVFEIAASGDVRPWTLLLDGPGNVAKGTLCMRACECAILHVACCECIFT